MLSNFKRVFEVAIVQNPH